MFVFNRTALRLLSLVMAMTAGACVDYGNVNHATADHDVPRRAELITTGRNSKPAR
jgi:predicted membrane protein